MFTRNSVGSRQRAQAFAKDTREAITAERAAKACSIVPSRDKAQLAAALALARSAVKLGPGSGWNLLALGMSEYRNGNDVAADRALLAAAEAMKNSPSDASIVMGTAAFYRAMTLFRQGKKDEAHKVAMASASAMKPLPADEQNPLSGDVTHEDLILWMAYKEAKAMIRFDAAPAAGTTDGK
jgi:hypothetical protein